MAVVDGHPFMGVVSVTGRACPLLGKGRPYLVTTNFYPPFGRVCRGRGAWAASAPCPARHAR